ncbi:hypothetical protein ACFYYU_49860 [Streptomyces olivochromogenes]|uniref:hypothetical protein n=1 Tax=Streptomyces olivochromogenes TaxID=1963 RepID=UPI00367699A2
MRESAGEGDGDGLWQTWALDAAGRLASWTTETNSSGTWTQTGSKTAHYSSDGDSPDWIQETACTITRNVQGSSGDLGRHH